MSNSFTLVLLSTLLFSVGHTVRTIRFKMLLNNGLETTTVRLLWGLNLGYLINFFFPFRFGELIRLLVSARTISIQSISILFTFLVIERTFDLLVLLFLSLLLWASTDQKAFLESCTLLLTPFVILSSFAIAILYAKKTVKRLIFNLASRFESSIQIKILDAAFNSILLAQRNMKILKNVKFHFATVFMWSSYLASLLCLANISMTKVGNFAKLWTVTFGISTNFWQLESDLDAVLSTGYKSAFFSTILLLGLVGIVVHILFSKYTVKTQSEENLFRPLTFANGDQKLEFLKIYFLGDHTSFCRSYIKLNGDDLIIRDSSGASSATTAIVTNEDSVVYRKYDRYNPEVLQLQARKMLLHKEVGYVEIQKTHNLPGLFAYDMPYKPNVISLSDYRYFVKQDKFIHVSKSILQNHYQTSRNLIKKTPLDKVKNAESESRRYLVSRLKSRIKLIKEIANEFSLPGNSNLFCNGEVVMSVDEVINHLESFEERKLITSIDLSSLIHGDFSPENIVIDLLSHENYRLIDPDPKLEIGSVLVDFAKYVNFFLVGFSELTSMKVNRIDVNSFHISEDGIEIYEKLRDINFLFDEKDVNVNEVQRVLLYNQLIHTLRIMPYQSNHNRLKIYLRFFREFSKQKSEFAL